MDEISTIGTTELQRATSKVLKRVYVGKERLVVERGGFPVAVLVSYQEFEELMRLVEKKTGPRHETVKKQKVKLEEDNL